MARYLSLHYASREGGRPAPAIGSIVWLGRVGLPSLLAYPPPTPLATIYWHFIFILYAPCSQPYRRANRADDYISQLFLLLPPLPLYPLIILNNAMPGKGSSHLLWSIFRCIWPRKQQGPKDTGVAIIKLGQTSPRPLCGQLHPKARRGAL